MLVALLVSGCAFSVGTIDGKRTETSTAGDGSTVVVVTEFDCDGVTFTGGAQGVGSACIEGGSVSTPFAGMLGGLFEAIGKLAAALAPRALAL